MQPAKRQTKCRRFVSKVFQEASAHCRDEVEVMMTRINMHLTGQGRKDEAAPEQRGHALIVFDVNELLAKTVEQVGAT